MVVSVVTMDFGNAEYHIEIMCLKKQGVTGNTRYALYLIMSFM